MEDTSFDEVHRSTSYVPSEETFPLQLKYVDMIWQTRTGIDHVSERTVNDYWHEESKDTLSEDWF